MTHPTCLICHRPVPGFDPPYSSDELPEPCLCSAECETAFNRGAGSYELRRIAAGIPVWRGKDEAES